MIERIPRIWKAAERGVTFSQGVILIAVCISATVAWYQCAVLFHQGAIWVKYTPFVQLGIVLSTVVLSILLSAWWNRRNVTFEVYLAVSGAVIGAMFAALLMPLSSSRVAQRQAMVFESPFFAMEAASYAVGIVMGVTFFSIAPTVLRIIRDFTYRR